ncbi:MAG: extracellular solute-binding protein [Chloroflexi bacterium]|nr:extracellular solute-binding protein [Chloroflexota bacterium]
MNKTLWYVIALVTLLSVLPACRQEAPAPPPAPAAQDKARPAPAAAEKWDQLVSEAKKEGKVVIYTAGPNEVKAALSEAFKNKYGIELEFVSGRGAELAAKIENERRAGLYLVDVGLIGLATYSTMLKPKNVTLPVLPLLLLPEVLDPKQWYGGKLPVLDQPGHAFAVALFAMPAYTYNTELVNPQEIGSALDLSSPKWKGKIVLGDPTIPGMGNDWYVTNLMYNLGMTKGREFMKSLAANVAAVTRDHRQLTEWVARGKYFIGIGASPSVPPEFIQSGAPIKFLDLKEARPIATGWGLLNVFQNAPHPRALQLFANWLLTREGLSAFSRGSNYPTARLDVPTESILPVMIPREGDKLTSDEYENAKLELMKAAAEDFAAAMK